MIVGRHHPALAGGDGLDWVERERRRIGQCAASDPAAGRIVAAKGVAITDRDVRSIRPGFGLEPKHLPEVLGRVARRDLARGEPFDLDMLD